MAPNKLAIHETLEIHEILTLKQSAILKAYAVQSLVDNNDLKKIIKKDIRRSEREIKELQELLEK